MFEILNLSSEIFYYKFSSVEYVSQQQAHISQYVVHTNVPNQYVMYVHASVHIRCAIQSVLYNEDIVYVLHFFSTQSQLKFA